MQAVDAPHRPSLGPTAVPRLLLTGIPGTGETTIGRHLEEHRGFTHVDLEHEPTSRRFLHRFGSGGGVGELDARVDELLAGAARVVVSWGFVPELQLELVLRLRERGFSWVFFDGDRAAARRAFAGRGTVELRHFEPQVAKLDRADVVALGAAVVNPFDASGRFRPAAAIADELLALARSARAQRAQSWSTSVPQTGCVW